MKLFFVELTPSDLLDKALISSGLSTQIISKISQVPKSDNSNVIVWAPKTPSDLKALPTLRKRQPATWIVLVVEDEWLKDAKRHNLLLACPEKNDVLLRKHWEATLGFSLQRATAQVSLFTRIATLKKECRDLKTHYEDLSASSTRLIEQLEKDVGLATDIQRSLLPKASPQIPGVSVSVKYLPAAGLGGDYYDLFDFGDRRHFGVLLADSKTHGMAAALLSVLLKVQLEKMKETYPDSKTFVEFLNQEIKNFHEKDLAPLSLLYGIFDRASLTFQYTSAGPLSPILWRGTRAVTLPVLNNPPLGGMNQYTFRETVTPLQPGDLLILHTDGLEAPLTASTNTQSAFERIVQILGRKQAVPDPVEVQIELLGLIDRYLETKPLADDLTLIQFAVDGHALYVASDSATPA